MLDLTGQRVIKFAGQLACKGDTVNHQNRRRTRTGLIIGFFIMTMMAACARQPAPTLTSMPSTTSPTETRRPTQPPTEVPKTSTPTPIIPTHYPMPTSNLDHIESTLSVSREEEKPSKENTGTNTGGSIRSLKPSLQIGKGMVTSIDVSPDGQWLSVGTPLGVYLYKADTFEQVWFVALPHPIENVSFDPTSKYLGVISDISIYAIDIEPGKIVEAFEDAGSSFAWSPDGKRLVSGGGCQTVTVWEMFTAKKLRELRGGLCSEGYSRIKVVWAPNGNIYATLSGTEIYSWDGTSLNQQNNLSIEAIQGSMAGVLAASRRGNLLAHYDGLGGSIVTIIDPETGNTRTLNGNINGPIDAIEWAPDGYRLAVIYGMNTNQTLIWDTRNSTVIKRIDGMKSLGGIGWTPDGKTIMGLQTLDGSLTAVNVNPGKVDIYLSGHESISGSLTWNQAGLIGAIGNKLTVWDPSSGDILQQEYVGTLDVKLLSWSPASPDSFLFISNQGEYSIGHGSARKPLQGINPLPLAWSPDGKSIAGRDRVWDAQTGNILTNLNPQNSQNERDLIAWSPDGTRLAFAYSLNAFLA